MGRSITIETWLDSRANRRYGRARKYSEGVGVAPVRRLFRKQERYVGALFAARGARFINGLSKAYLAGCGCSGRRAYA